jgi:hypothetical protein
LRHLLPFLSVIILGRKRRTIFDFQFTIDDLRFAMVRPCSPQVDKERLLRSPKRTRNDRIMDSRLRGNDKKASHERRVTSHE